MFVARVSGIRPTDEPTILHADLDSFYTSVEQRDDPALRGRPVIVGGGVVLAASYEAKAYGVRTAMGGRQARRLCPGLVEVRPRLQAYLDASRAVFDVFHDTTPLVEGISIDEAFLDVGGLGRVSGAPSAIADRLRRRVLEEVGLPITVGVAATKFLAKVASAVAKPDGLLVVPRGAELAFLHPLPVERLWGVGRVTSEKLQARGITTVGELAAVPESALVAMLGRRVRASSACARPPPRPAAGRDAAGGAGRWAPSDALGWRRREFAEVEVVAPGARRPRDGRMRAAGVVGRTVIVRFRFDDFSRATRSHTMPMATAETRHVVDAARGLLLAERPLIRRAGLTLVGVSVSNLQDARAVQLPLPFDASRTAPLSTRPSTP